MKIAKNTVVALTYELIVDGSLADKATEEKPLEFIQGTGMLLPKFEAAIEGKEPGEGFAFTLTPEEGYGQTDPSYVIDLPKSSFEVDGQVREELLVVGRVIPMLNSDGQVIQGTVAGVSDKTVRMDFNHPMAGKTLNFTGAIVSVREATEKELTEGLHGEYLPQEEGCGHCCHHGEGGEEGCCHGGGHEDGECCHGEGGHKCHGEGRSKGKGCCKKDKE